MTTSQQGELERQPGDVIRGWESAAELAGRSVASVRKLVDGGRLHAVKAPDGVHEFTRADLVALPRVLRAPEDETPGGPPGRTAIDDARATGAPNLEAGQSSPVAAPEGTPAMSIPGELAACLFAAFESGSAPVAVVIETKQPPGVVERAYEDWTRMKAIDISSTSAQSRIAELDGVVRQIAEALELLLERVDRQDGLLNEMSTSTWRQGQSIAELARRVTAVERGVRAGGHVPTTVANLQERTTAVEQGVQALASWMTPWMARRG